MESKLENHDHFLGIEIEIEKASDLDLIKSKYWTVKTDGSLRNNGRELVFKKPFKGTNAEEAIEEAFEQLLSPKMQVSPRTSIHVHVDASTMAASKLGNICILYPLVEEPLFDWVGDHRDTNNFCLPWYEAEGDIEKVAKLLKNPEKMINEAANLHRYSALNLNALNKFRSIEFRHLLTTKNKNRVYAWVNMLLRLKEASLIKRNKYEEILESYYDTGKAKFLKSIFGEWAKQLDHTKILLGPQIAQDILAVNSIEADSLFMAHMFTPGTPKGYEEFITNKGIR